MHPIRYVLALTVTLASLALAIAEPVPAPARLVEADVAALQHHHGVNLMEIEMGQMAQAKGSDPVKKYAAALVRDHQKADKEALALAQARGVTLEEHPATAEHKQAMETMARLKTLDGATFDREYLSAMVDGHTAEAGYLTIAIGKVRDAKLKAHFTKVKPVAERHAEQARALFTPPKTTARQR